MKAKITLQEIAMCFKLFSLWNRGNSCHQLINHFMSPTMLYYSVNGIICFNSLFSFCSRSKWWCGSVHHWGLWIHLSPCPSWRWTLVRNNWPSTIPQSTHSPPQCTDEQCCPPQRCLPLTLFFPKMPLK